MTFGRRAIERRLAAAARGRRLAAARRPGGRRIAHLQAGDVAAGLLLDKGLRAVNVLERDAFGVHGRLRYDGIRRDRQAEGQLGRLHARGDFPLSRLDVGRGGRDAWHGASHEASGQQHFDWAKHGYGIESISWDSFRNRLAHDSTLGFPLPPGEATAYRPP